MSFLKGLKDAVWEDSKKPVEQPKGNATPQRISTPVNTLAPTIPGAQATQALAHFTTTDNGAESGIDTNAVEGQLDQLVQSNPSFATAATFISAAEALLPLLKDEGLCFKSAQATSKLDPSAVLESVNTFQSVIETEKQNFEAHFVGGQQATIDQVNAQAAGLDDQIKQLAEQLGQLNEQRQQLGASAAQQTASLGKSRIDFDMVVNKISTKYGDIAKKVQQHLGVQ